MTADAFRHRRERKVYTLDEAARAGLSRRMVGYYQKGDCPIRRVVALQLERWIWRALIHEAVELGGVLADDLVAGGCG
jgi:predicted transcriptional regulator